MSTDTDTDTIISSIQKPNGKVYLLATDIEAHLLRQALDLSSNGNDEGADAMKLIAKQIREKFIIYEKQR